ncbi:hypothetical protein [Neobacillus sp. DY30]|uniref:hypothetical protein n=1 Tax=Neobacillus sp. DY30 TaxID=3047871 RepID=UPI0024C020AE|nr:hypothetical protein [Neobacillus sp. DY30]WHY01816.1 hypothetical protein QNH29_06205 [Neobacillus sp. DY30]
MEILQAFLNGLFGSLFIGTIFNILLSLYFFISNKREFNEWTWSSFVVPAWMLLGTSVLGVGVYFIN